MIKNWTLFSLLTFVAGGINCTKSKYVQCEEPLNIFDSRISFYLANPSGTPLVGEFGRPYRSDLVQFLNYDGTEAPACKVDGNGVLSVNPSNRADSSDQPQIKTFLVVLPSTSANPEEDVDTLGIKYNVVLTECNRLWYDTVSLYYNQKLVYTGNYPSADLKITK